MELEPGVKLSEAGPSLENWKVATLRQLAADKRNAIVGTPSARILTAEDYRTSEVFVVRGSNIHGRYVHGPFAYVGKAKTKALAANLSRAGDVAFTQRETLGQVALVPNNSYDEYLVL